MLDQITGVEKGSVVAQPRDGELEGGGDFEGLSRERVSAKRGQCYADCGGGCKNSYL